MLQMLQLQLLFYHVCCRTCYVAVVILNIHIHRYQKAKEYLAQARSFVV